MRLSDIHKKVSAVFRFDIDALAYINSVEQADMQSLEQNVKLAINDFVIGCKKDNIWDAIKSSCILAGARTLQGALVPLKGVSPTNVDFVSSDYSRVNGLQGDGITKVLNSNINGGSLIENDVSVGVWVSLSGSGAFLGQSNGGDRGVINFVSGIYSYACRLQNSINDTVSVSGPLLIGLKAMNRSSYSEYVVRSNSIDTSVIRESNGKYFANIQVFGRNAGLRYNGRLSFYFIGNSLNLSLLDSRITNLINAYNELI